MSMKFRILKNIFRQGLQSMWRNRGMGLASITSITAVLVILGLVLIMILSINNVVVEAKNKFDEIQVFLEDDISTDELHRLEDTIRNSEEVLSVMYQTKDQALEIMKEEWQEDSYLLEGLEENPLPNAFKVKVKDIEYSDLVVDRVKELEGVEDIVYYKDIIDRLVLFAGYIRLGGLAIIGILMIISIFIISNTIKITVSARKNEIGIMKYVGATNGYIRGPFIIEGVLFGLIGAILSVLVVNYGYQYFFNAVSDQLYVLFTIYLVPPTSLVKDISIIFAAMGMGIGALGSLLSLKRFLNV
ncbi:MAG: ABC transporter permease [Tissierellia bacterium]|nr:ABC transporter permease [Tissierellia bacterium]